MRALSILIPLVIFSIAYPLRFGIVDDPVESVYFTRLAARISSVLSLEGEITYFNGYPQAVDALKAGRIDVVLGLKCCERGLLYVPLPVLKVKLGRLGEGERVGIVGEDYPNLSDAIRDLQEGKLDAIVYRCDVLASLGNVKCDGPQILLYTVVNSEELLRKITDAMVDMYKSVSIDVPQMTSFPKSLDLVVVDLPPYEYEEDGVWKGSDVETVVEVLKEMGFEVNLVEVPPVRAFKMLMSGEIDGAFSLEKTPEREEILVYVDEPVSFGADVLFYRKGDVPKMGSTCGYVPGYAIQRTLVSMGFTLIPVKDDETGIVLVSSGRLDVFATNLLSGLYFIEKHSIDNLTYSRPIRVYSSYLAFSRNSGYEPLAVFLTEKLRKFKTSQRYVEILKKYGVDYSLFWRK